MGTRNFIGRQQEIDRIHSLKARDKASLIVIRGRRRIGKSRLIQESARDSLFLKFSGLAPDEGITAEAQRKNFAMQLAKNFNTHTPDSSDWFHLLEALAKSLPKKPLILLFDEISWMGQDDPTFLPKIKNLWDDELNTKQNIIFCLCGSVSPWIEKNILSSSGFLGRINETISLEELSLKESLELLHIQKFKGSHFEKLMVLSVTGGVPWYIEQFSKAYNAPEHIKNLCFKKDGLFTLEFTRIFNDLFGRRANAYLKIISTLTNGAKEYKKISEMGSYPSSGMLSEYLEDLIVSGFIQKTSSWNFKTGILNTLILYRLSDNYLRFYLKYIQPNLSKIQENHFEQQGITELPGFSNTIGLQLENLVLKNKHLIYDKLNINRLDIVADGPYFQRTTTRQAGCQIDLLIQTKLNTFYVCEIKFTRSTLSSGVIKEVADKISKLEKPKGSAFIPVLIYFGDRSDKLMDTDYFYRAINFGDFLE